MMSHQKKSRIPLEDRSISGSEEEEEEEEEEENDKSDSDSLKEDNSEAASTSSGRESVAESESVGEGSSSSSSSDVEENKRPTKKEKTKPTKKKPTKKPVLEKKNKKNPVSAKKKSLLASSTSFQSFVPGGLQELPSSAVLPQPPPPCERCHQPLVCLACHPPPVTKSKPKPKKRTLKKKKEEQKTRIRPQVKKIASSKTAKSTKKLKKGGVVAKIKPVKGQVAVRIYGKNNNNRLTKLHEFASKIDKITLSNISKIVERFAKRKKSNLPEQGFLVKVKNKIAWFCLDKKGAPCSNEKIYSLREPVTIVSLRKLMISKHLLL
jgi:hypothetical protein